MHIVLSVANFIYDKMKLVIVVLFYDSVCLMCIYKKWLSRNLKIWMLSIRLKDLCNNWLQALFNNIFIKSTNGYVLDLFLFATTLSLIASCFIVKEVNICRKTILSLLWYHVLPISFILCGWSSLLMYLSSFYWSTSFYCFT